MGKRHFSSVSLFGHFHFLYFFPHKKYSSSHSFTTTSSGTSCCANCCARAGAKVTLALAVTALALAPAELAVAFVLALAVPIAAAPQRVLASRASTSTSISCIIAVTSCAFRYSKNCTRPKNHNRKLVVETAKLQKTSRQSFQKNAGLFCDRCTKQMQTWLLAFALARSAALALAPALAFEPAVATAVARQFESAGVGSEGKPPSHY